MTKKEKTLEVTEIAPLDEGRESLAPDFEEKRPEPADPSAPTLSGFELQASGEGSVTHTHSKLELIRMWLDAHFEPHGQRRQIPATLYADEAYAILESDAP